MGVVLITFVSFTMTVKTEMMYTFGAAIFFVYYCLMMIAQSLNETVAGLTVVFC